MAQHPIGIRSARLRLDPLKAADADDLLAVYGNPDTWRHLPEGRFTNIGMAYANIAASEQSRRARGLGNWAIRVGAAGADGSLNAGDFIGTGGVRYLEEPRLWNLGYRLDPRAWGRGFATEIAFAAVDAAAQVDPHTPVTGRALSNNPASISVLEKVGLTLIWEGHLMGASPPANGEQRPLRRVYADRALTASAYDWLVANA